VVERSLGDTVGAAWLGLAGVFVGVLLTAGVDAVRERRKAANERNARQLDAAAALLRASWSGAYNEIQRRHARNEGFLDLIPQMDDSRTREQEALSLLYFIGAPELVQAAQNLRNTENALFHAVRSDDLAVSMEIEGWKRLKQAQGEARDRLVNVGRGVAHQTKVNYLALRGRD
jgi:hypothetical protein